MGTPALIIVNDNGVFKSVICRGDGYLDHTGLQLQERYDTKDKAMSLIAPGSFCGIYDHEVEYFQDGSNLVRSNTLSEAIKSHSSVNYIYLFQDCIWSLVDRSSCMRLYWYNLEEDTVWLDCSICNHGEEIIADNDFGNWVSEVFVGKENLGCICPMCQDRYTKVNPIGECEIILEQVDLNKCPGLTKWLKERFQQDI